jgi:hypothetical protein
MFDLLIELEFKVRCALYMKQIKMRMSCVSTKAEQKDKGTGKEDMGQWEKRKHNMARNTNFCNDKRIHSSKYMEKEVGIRTHDEEIKIEDGVYVSETEVAIAAGTLSMNGCYIVEAAVRRSELFSTDQLQK